MYIWSHFFEIINKSNLCCTLFRDTVSIVIPAKAGIQPLLRTSMKYKDYYVYIMASQRNGTLYIGVTNDLVRRAYEHKNNITEGFTKKYNVHDLVYNEVMDGIDNAIIREKQVKKWKRSWKLRLIEEQNSSWNDLYQELL